MSRLGYQQHFRSTLGDQAGRVRQASRDREVLLAMQPQLAAMIAEVRGMQARLGKVPAWGYTYAHLVDGEAALKTLLEETEP